VWLLARAWTWCLFFGVGFIAAEVIYFLMTKGPWSVAGTDVADWLCGLRLEAA
jgi:hypothetical protein